MFKDSPWTVTNVVCNFMDDSFSISMWDVNSLRERKSNRIVALVFLTLYFETGKTKMIYVKFLMCQYLISSLIYSSIFYINLIFFSVV